MYTLICPNCGEKFCLTHRGNKFTCLICDEENDLEDMDFEYNY